MLLTIALLLAMLVSFVAATKLKTYFSSGRFQMRAQKVYVKAYAGVFMNVLKVVGVVLIIGYIFNLPALVK